MIDNKQEIVKEKLRINGLGEPLIEEMLTVGRHKRMVSGDYLFSADPNQDEVPFVLTGLLKVLRHDEESGNELFLYYLESGETCAMSIQCCLQGTGPSYQIVAEEQSELWMVPVRLMDQWLVRYEEFRRFVFRSYQMRFDELLTTIDSVVFTQMDDRILKYLLDTKQATESFVIHKTHAQIARELSTSRVVVSRLLKKLESAGKIEQYRNRIEIL